MNFVHAVERDERWVKKWVGKVARRACGPAAGHASPPMVVTWIPVRPRIALTLTRSLGSCRSTI